MNNSINYTTLDRVLAKISRETGATDIHKDDIIEWIGEALGYMNKQAILEERVVFLPVRNYTADIPEYFQMLIQVAYDNEGCISDFEKIISTCYSEFEGEITSTYGKTEEPEKTEYQEYCEECCSEDEGEQYTGNYRAFGQAHSLYYDWTKTKLYRGRFSPIRLSNDTLFKTTVCKSTHTESIHTGNSLEYTIVGVTEKKLRFSFSSGVVALSYLRNMLDPETGYPIIPDDEKALAAITYYVKWKFAERMVFTRKEGYKYISEDNERKWGSYIKKFNSASKMPKTLDEYQNLLMQTFQIAPNFNKYNNYFGKFRHGR